MHCKSTKIYGNYEQKPANIVDAYRRYMKLERNFTQNTLDAYMRDIGKLLLFLASEGVEPQAASLDDLRRFAASLHDIGVSPRTQCRILSGVRSFYHFLLLDGYIADDPTELLESPQIGEHLPEVLTTGEVDLMEQAVDLSKWEGQRNKAIVEVLFSCGLRVSELVTLRLSDLYLDEGFIRVKGKGRKERLVPISDSAVGQLRLWFDDRCRMDIKPGEEDYVFLNRRGAHLTRTMILIMVKRLGAEAGIKKTISPTRCAIASPRRCSKAVPTCAPYRPCWGMRASERPRFTLTSTPTRCARKSLSTIRETSITQPD